MIVQRKLLCFEGEIFTTKDRVRFPNDSIVITVVRDRGIRERDNRRSRVSQRRFYSVYEENSKV